MDAFAPMTEQEEKDWLATIEGENDEAALDKLKPCLLPKTEGFFQAPSGHRLHVRTVLPPGDMLAMGVKAIVLYCHGLNSHVNNKNWAGGLFPRIAAEGFAVVAMDIQGHGYSEGVRSLVEDWEAVFTDWEMFVEVLLGVAEPMPSSQEFGAGIPDEVLLRLRRLPVFVMGTSMGGMIGMYVGLRMQQNERLRDRLQGAVLCCPSLTVDLPPKAVQVLLRNLVVPLFKTSEMPACVSSSAKSSLSWAYDLTNPQQRQLAETEIRDCAARFPGQALGWHKGMRWGTAGAFSQLYSNIEENMKHVGYPFIVVHDPGDKICFFQGSERLMELCASTDKTLQAADAKGLHVLPMVVQEEFVASVTEWMRQRS